MIAVDGCVLPVHYVFDLADCLGSNILHPFDMLRNEQKMMRIDVASLNEAFRFLRTTGRGFFELTRPHWLFMKLLRSRRARTRH